MIAVLGHVQHPQRPRSRADGHLATVRGDAHVGHDAFVLSLQQEIREIHGPDTKLAVFGASHAVATVDAERVDGAGVQLVGAQDLVGLAANAQQQPAIAAHVGGGAPSVAWSSPGLAEERNVGEGEAPSVLVQQHWSAREVALANAPKTDVFPPAGGQLELLTGREADARERELGDLLGDNRGRGSDPPTTPTTSCACSTQSGHVDGLLNDQGRHVPDHDLVAVLRVGACRHEHRTVGAERRADDAAQVRVQSGQPLSLAQVPENHLAIQRA
mmetsp:Transcript_27160/g.45497  ORF Transcript_27160/g.45497 Transcript_27160/m.45497 type:complete len:272 (+) Transcript_27160:739-1554(+)